MAIIFYTFLYLLEGCMICQGTVAIALPAQITCWKEVSCKWKGSFHLHFTSVSTNVDVFFNTTFEFWLFFSDSSQHSPISFKKWTQTRREHFQSKTFQDQTKNKFLHKDLCSFSNTIQWERKKSAITAPTVPH